MTPSEMTARNDLVWLANGYVTGELSADETVAFESRMKTDVVACDAVARAMELNLAIAAAFDRQTSQPVVRRIQETASPARWSGVTLTALAASAVAAASVALMIGRSGSTTNEFARKDGTERIVAAWASGEAARNNTDDDDLVDATDDNDLDPPDWMLAALTVEDVKEQLPGNGDIREN